MGLLFARQKQLRSQVLEGGVAPSIRISIHESRRTTVSRQEQASIATSTPQQQAITEALEKVITAINRADLSEKEKNVAKSLLRKLLGSKAAGNVLGAGAQSLARVRAQKTVGSRDHCTSRVCSGLVGGVAQGCNIRSTVAWCSVK